jgi:hypothetical protein
MRNGLVGLAVGVGLALVLGVLVVGVAGAQTPTGGGPFGMHGAVWARAAAILGVPEAKLTDAFAQALDDAVKAGQLTQPQADWMTQHHRGMPQGGAASGMMGGTGMMGRRGMMGGDGRPWGATPTPTR